MRRVRQPNAIDFWRGAALIMIFVNHVPGNIFVPLTLRNYALCDAAELFVFLAGWSMAYVAGPPARPTAFPLVKGKFLQRAGEIYVWQLVTTSIAVGLLAVAASATQNPLFYEWHNAGTAFFDPGRAALGTVLLSYQIGYFNILPVYIVLLLAAPVMVILYRWHVAALIGASIGLYLLAATFRLSPPSWPTTDPWYMNPLSWQVMLVMGFNAGQWSLTGPRMADTARRWWPLAVLAFVAAAVLAELEISPDPLDVPEPRALFAFDKAYMSPARIASLVAVVVTFAFAYDPISQRAPWLAEALCRLGRNSLEVFSVSTVLALAGQIGRFLSDGRVWSDVVIIASGLVLMHLTAWSIEWRRRAK
jgi:hypothetical protein